METNNKKSLRELIKKVEVLQEDQQGQLKGGFVCLSLALRSEGSLQHPEGNKNKHHCINNNCSCPSVPSVPSAPDEML